MEHAHMWVSIPIGLTHLIPSWGTAASSFSYRRRPLCRSLCTIPSPCWPFLTSDCPSLFQPCRESSCSTPLEFPRMPALHRVFHSWICTYGVIISSYCVHGSLYSHPHSVSYTSNLTSARVIKSGLVFAIKSILLVLPLPCILHRLILCKKSLPSHSCCLHQDVMKLACSDNRVNLVHGLFVALTAVSELVCISVSYLLISKIVLGPASHRGSLKVLDTCISHMWSVLIFYMPFLTLPKMSHQLLRSSLLISSFWSPTNEFHCGLCEESTDSKSDPHRIM